MNTNLQNNVTIYLHPEDGGPISPLELDMLAIEIKAVSSTDFRNRDEVRINEIIALIKAKFPKLDPGSRRRDLTHLISRLVQVSMFDGVALHVPGKIDGASPPSDKNAAAAAKQLSELTEEVMTLRRDKQELAAQYDTLNVRVPNLEQNNKQLREAYSKEHQELVELRTQLNDVDVQINRLSSDAKKCRDRIKQLEVANGELQTQVNLANRDKQTLRSLQQELISLRQGRDNAVKAEQQLRETIKKRDQEIHDLRERLRHNPNLSPRGGEPPKGKESWRDD